MSLCHCKKAIFNAKCSQVDCSPEAAEEMWTGGPTVVAVVLAEAPGREVVRRLDSLVAGPGKAVVPRDYYQASAWSYFWSHQQLLPQHVRHVLGGRYEYVVEYRVLPEQPP